jgi:hypothetical protein
LQSTFPQSTTSGSRSSSSSQQTEESALMQRQEGNAQNVSQTTSSIQSGIGNSTSRGGGGSATP